MCKIKKLIDSILKDGKMNADSIITHLITALEECECGEKESEYKLLYEDSYGHVFTKDIAEDWVKSMAVTDGSERTSGQKWTLEQTTEIGNKIAVDWTQIPKLNFYIVMNMMYSDYYKAAKAVGLADDTAFYARLAKDWLYDEDAQDEKLYKYYFDVVK